MQTPPRWRSPLSATLRRGLRLLTHPLVLLLILVAALLGGIYLATAQTVTINLNGTTFEVRTHQSTVGGLLDELSVSLETQDVVSPPGDSPIRNGLTVTIQKAHPVIVEADGQQRRIFTQSNQPREILAQAGITPGAHDLIRVDNADLKAEPYTTPPKHILVLRAYAIPLDDNGAESTLYSVHRTVGEALHDAGIALYLGDSVSPDPGAALIEGSQITIRRSVPVTILVDGHTLATRTHGQTVNAALAEAGLGLVGLDYVIPNGDTPISPNMTLRVVRVSEEDLIGQQTVLDFKHILKADPAQPIDTRQVIQAGKPGIVAQVTRIRREDGVEVSRSPIENVVIQAAQDEIVAVGTQVTIKALDTPDGPIQYWRVLKMRVASYKPSSTGKSADDPQYGLTATGQKLRKGLAAVDPSVIPLGTQMYVPGYGLAMAADVGGGVQGLVIDLGYRDDDYQEWSGTVDVYLLPPVPPQDQIRLFPEEAH